MGEFPVSVLQLCSLFQIIMRINALLAAFKLKESIFFCNESAPLMDPLLNILCGTFKGPGGAQTHPFLERSIHSWTSQKGAPLRGAKTEKDKSVR